MAQNVGFGTVTKLSVTKVGPVNVVTVRLKRPPVWHQIVIKYVRERACVIVESAPVMRLSMALFAKSTRRGPFYALTLMIALNV